jgi:N-acetylneuraminate synthase
MNLRTIPDLREKMRLPVGLSDHTLGIAASVASVVLGVTFIEKHFTLSRKLKTPDSFFSLEPHELKDLVDNVRMVEQSLGTVHYGLTKDEKKSRVFRRSLFIVHDIKKGEKFSEQNIASIRPSAGLKPKYLKSVLGTCARKNLRSGTPLSFASIDGNPKFKKGSAQ